MKSQHLKDVTPEMRLEMQEKARLSRIAKREYAEANLKTEYADMTYWKSLAGELNVRLPQRYDVGVKGIKRVCNQLGIEVSDYVMSTGCKTLQEWVKLNPTWGALPLACMVMEYYVEERMSEASN